MSIGYERVVQARFFPCDGIPPSLLHVQAFEALCHTAMLDIGQLT